MAAEFENRVRKTSPVTNIDTIINELSRCCVDNSNQSFAASKKNISKAKIQHSTKIAYSLYFDGIGSSDKEVCHMSGDNDNSLPLHETEDDVQVQPDFRIDLYSPTDDWNEDPYPSTSTDRASVSSESIHDDYNVDEDDYDDDDGSRSRDGGDSWYEPYPSTSSDRRSVVEEFDYEDSEYSNYRDDSDYPYPSTSSDRCSVVEELDYEESENDNEFDSDRSFSSVA